ncbi:MAG: type transport system ATP-binding protein [Eubacteriaceae bacterium]|jgi:ABC-2 type transport system ATP-binding protein|nr:type transport system ATP-binding protein [Eubacteriaceae bacterium]MDK2937610.1 type transport system ATP-binding protein [Eubacteriaceae bacterium]MDN5307585.1 type transport system ATP-binding protein [Eubacteriaceae bacterium]
MENALTINHLSKTYTDFKLDDISFTVPKGCVVGLIGENGAGKTTTLKAALNLIKNDCGETLFFDQILDENSSSLKEDIGVVLDAPCFHDVLRVRDINKVMKNIYSNWDDQRFIDLIFKFKLPMDKRVKEYSKGMKMKLQIAVALAHNPKLLILDEATSGLDPVAREEMMDIFQEFIQNENNAILMSSHITSDLDKIADYIVFIHNGKVVFQEEKESLLEMMGILKCGASQFESLDANDYHRYRKNQFGYEVLVKNRPEIKKRYRDVMIDPATIEEIMLFFVKGEVA